MTVEDIARVCHHVNKAYCECLGDYSQPEWRQAPDWQRQSAINGVLFHLENPLAPASVSHEEWLKEKLDDGWKYGPVKNADKKEHPCCVDYSDLPVEQRAKDYIFAAICSALKELLTDQEK